MDPTIGFRLAHLVFCCALVVVGGLALLSVVVLRRPRGASLIEGAMAFGGGLLLMGAASPFLVLTGALVSIGTVDVVWELGVWARWVVVVGASVPLVAGVVALVHSIWRG